MKRLSLLLTLLGLLAVLAIPQVGAAAGAPARPEPNFAHPTLRDDSTDLEGEEEAEETEFESEDCEAEAEAGEFEFEFEEEEFEEQGEEGEEEELEFEEECGAAAKASKQGAPFVTAPAPCEVRQAESTITTLPASDEVRLTLRYQTWSPTPVTVGLKLKDAKGAVAIERASKHLSGKGVLHLTTKLGSAVMNRAGAANEFDVSLRAPQTPGYCAAALEQQLHAAKHTGGRAPRVYAN